MLILLWLTACIISKANMATGHARVATVYAEASCYHCEVHGQNRAISLVDDLAPVSYVVGGLTHSTMES